MYVHHVFFIHVPTDGHLGWFCVSALMNGAIINTDKQLYFSVLVSFLLLQQIAGKSTLKEERTSLVHDLRGLVHGYSLSLSFNHLEQNFILQDYPYGERL